VASTPLLLGLVTMCRSKAAWFHSIS
jgi:hypothetical protein